MPICFCGDAQIKLPKGFQCVKGDSYRENFFRSGGLSFNSDAFGSAIDNPSELKGYLQTMCYKNKIEFKNTNDGLVWGSGAYINKWIYVVGVPNQKLVFTLNAAINDTAFSYYSKWLLGQIRYNITMGNELYFADYKGRSCH